MEKRLTIIKIIMGLTIFYGFIGAFIAHWFFPDFYFLKLMEHSQYQDSMVKLIGIYGIFLSLLAFFVIKSPLKNRDIVISIIVLGFSMGASFIFFILFKDFPNSQYINVILLFILSIMLLAVYPWEAAKDFRSASNRE